MLHDSGKSSLLLLLLLLHLNRLRLLNSRPLDLFVHVHLVVMEKLAPPVGKEGINKSSEEEQKDQVKGGGQENQIKLLFVLAI